MNAKKEVLVATVPEPSVATEERQLASQVSDIEFQAESIIISTDDDYKAAGEFGKVLAGKKAEVTAFFKPLKDAANKAHKAICDRENAMLAPLKSAEKILKESMSAYYAEQEKKHREAEEAARRAMEAERERLIAEAVSKEKIGDKDGAQSAITEACVMDEAAKFVTPSVSQPKVQGVSATKDWEITEIDSNVVPLSFSGIELRPVDKGAVMRLIRASKGQVQIPGVAYREVAKMSFRRA